MRDVHVLVRIDYTIHGTSALRGYFVILSDIIIFYSLAALYDLQKNTELCIYMFQAYV